MTLLTLEDVTRSVVLPDEVTLTILTGVNLTVEAGDHVSIVGRSGSGKTTLLNLIGLIDKPTTGTVRYSDIDPNALSNAKRDRLRGRDIGFVFQQFNLLAGRTALENVMTPLLYATGKQFWQRKAIATEMLDRVGLSHRINSLPERLSGGEQQRVAIARALIRSPKLILADEPTGALDIETGDAVMRLLHEMTASSGSALVTITHDPNVAALAGRHYRLDAGVLKSVDVTDLDHAVGVPR